jgi:flagellar basal-body rod modification protein FlgD
MAPQAISGSYASSTLYKPTTKNFNDLQSEDFFGLLIAQLQSQDPLKPTDNQALLDQMSSIRQMEQSTTLNRTLTLLAAEQRFGATSGLIGHYVSGTVKDQNGNSAIIRGIVTGVHFEGGGRAVLELHDGRMLPADKVEQVTLVQNLPEEIQKLLAEAGESGGEAETAAATASRATQPNVAAPAKTTSAAAVKSAPDGGLVGGFLRSLLGTGGTAGISV